MLLVIFWNNHRVTPKAELTPDIVWDDTGNVILRDTHWVLVDDDRNTVEEEISKYPYWDVAAAADGRWVGIDDEVYILDGKLVTEQAFLERYGYSPEDLEEKGESI